MNVPAKAEVKEMIKARTFPTIALTISLLTISAAAQKSEAPVPDYFPLRVGDSWTYRSAGSDTQYSVTVLGEEKQADGTIRYLVEKLAGAKVHTLFSKASGWVLMHSERYPEHEGLEAKYEPARQYLKNPLRAGAQWGWKGEDYTKKELEEVNQVVGPEDVTVPAGKFRAMKVVSKVAGATAPLTRTSWYADGVGLVKSMTEAGQIKYGWELADYSFKNKDRSK
jgi:hypothetical protein